MDFQSFSRIRVNEAKALLHLKHYSGAYYLAGYAVECALKALTSSFRTFMAIHQIAWRVAGRAVRVG